MFASRNGLLVPKAAAPVITYDATGAAAASGYIGNSGGSTWNHVAAAGAYVIVAIVTAVNVAISAVKWGGSGGTAMTLLGTVNNNNNAANGQTAFYGIAGVSAGTTSVYVQCASNVWMMTQSVSVLGEHSISAATTTNGTTTGSLSQATTLGAAGMIVQALGCSSAAGGTPGILTSPSGGTNRFHGYNWTGSAIVCGLALGTATAGTTFSGSVNGSTFNWAGIYVTVS